jgi:hypothetical protein
MCGECNQVFGEFNHVQVSLITCLVSLIACKV